MTSFADLGLNPSDVRADLQAMGIDDSVYTDAELSSLLLVSDLVLEQAIFDSAENVESLMFEYTYQADRLASMQSTFNRLLATMAAENATASALIDFLEGEDVYLDVGDASLITIDHNWSYSDGSTTYALEEFETLQDFLSAVENNETVNYSDGSGSTTALEFAYAEGVADGWINGVVQADGTTATLSDFLGGGDYYLSVDIGDSSTDFLLDLDNFQQYLLARVLNEAGYIGDDVLLDPAYFANHSVSGQQGLNSMVEMVQLYFGRTTIDFDAGAGTVSLRYNGAAAMREMGHSVEDYFGEEDPEWSKDGEEEVSNGYNFNQLVNGLPVFTRFDGNWLTVLVGSYSFGSLEGLRPFSAQNRPGATLFENATWTDFSDDELTAVRRINREYTSYLGADKLDDLLENVGAALQSQSSTGELALVEASTALTEWSELHGGWDTVNKYITDALGRAVALMK